MPGPLDQYNPLALIFVGAGLIPEGQPPITAAITMPPKGATAEFGKYIVSYQDCVLCHGTDLSGGKPGQLTPIGPNLSAVKGWTVEQFITAMRSGVNPDGHTLSSQMPWRNIGRMDDEELTALYAYITH
jgi:mono/diheme cytochrome c family protein